MLPPLLSKFCLTFLLLFIGILNVFSQLNVYAYIDDARKEMDKKNYFEAIQKLDVCIEVRPKEYVAYFYRGICKYYLKDNLGAEQDLNSAMSAYNPLLYDTYHYRSLVKYQLGDYEGAIKDIDHVIDAMGNDPQLLVERAFYKLSDQNFSGAIGDCNNALHMHYMGKNVYLCMGMAENAISKYDSALINYKIALKLDPKDIDVYVRIGMTKYNLGQYKESLEQYNQALELDSSSTLAYYNRAEAKIKLNNDTGAIKDFNMVIFYDPMNDLAYFNRGVLEANQNDYTDALADFDKVLTMNPKNIQALLTRAKIKTQQKDYKGAIGDYTESIGLYPYLVEAYYERGHLKEKLKDHTGAKEDYELGHYIAASSHLNDTLQRAKDSARLMHMMVLNSNFNSGQKLSDTTNIDLMPFFYMTVKGINYAKTDCIPLLFKKSKTEYPDFCLTNKTDPTEDISKEGPQSILNKPAKDSTWRTEALIEKAVQETNMQLFNAAITDYTEATNRDTGYALAYFARGIDLCRETEILGRLNTNEPDIYIINKTYRVTANPANDTYEKALADFNKTIQLEPDFAFAFYDRAYVKYKLNDFRGAIDDYNYAIQCDPGFADAYYNRAILLFCLNDKIDACVDFSKAGELGLTKAYLIIKAYCSEVTK